MSRIEAPKAECGACNTLGAAYIGVHTCPGGDRDSTHSDGEQRKYHNFWDYPVQGLINTAPDGFRIPFAAGHTRRMPRLVRGPFSYRRR